MNWKTDRNSGKTLCLLCDKLHDVGSKRCDRCGASLHQRKENSMILTFNFVVVAIAFLVPANVLPIMYVTTLGEQEARTIMDGIVHFFHTGAYFIGLVVLIASIIVPFVKLWVLLYLLFIVQFKKDHLAYRATKYFRMITFIGKWSMLDVFVIALMVTMVQFQKIAMIDTGPAAFAFTLAVVSTILATRSFDPRLLWSEEE